MWRWGLLHGQVTTIHAALPSDTDTERHDETGESDPQASSI